MRKECKSALAFVLTLAMLSSMFVLPVQAITFDTDVYDNAIDMQENYFEESVKFDSTGKTEITHDEWYDQMQITGINRERANAQFIPYQDADTALASEKSVLDDIGYEESEYYQLLSGTEWDFALVGTAKEASQLDDIYLAEDLVDDYKTLLKDVYNPGFLTGYMSKYLNMDIIDSNNYGAFTKEYVPQSWQTYKNADGTFKYFDEPIYSGNDLPWVDNFGNGNDYVSNIHAPEVDTYNPVGYYRTTFSTPTNWDGREIFISFQSVESSYYVYVNGEAVGYSTDSFTAHDFNITEYLNPAGEENTLALKVHRWSIGSWLENQDVINFSGINRDVFLYSKDEAEIRDVFIKTKFADRTSVDSDVTVTVETDVRGLHNTADTDYTVSMYLVDDEGNTVITVVDQTVNIATSSTKSQEEVLLDKGTTVTTTFEVTNPDKWFADTPNLYRLVVELKKGSDVLESIVERVGFREIYKVDYNLAGNEQMQITGKQMVFRGVNRTDIDLNTGHALTKKDYIEDLFALKQMNMNAIRTANYPNDNILYEIADEIGIYVTAEANIESDNASVVAPVGLTSSENADWVAACLDRIVSNTEQYKNNPSVAVWSLGNDAVYSRKDADENHAIWVGSMWTLARDPSRLRMNERTSDGYYGFSYKKLQGEDPMEIETRQNNIVDIHSTTYVSPGYVGGYSAKMPHLHAAYNHSMGTSYGNAKEHWDSIRSNSGAQGGFVWDLVDQSIETTRNGEIFFGYGGDWIDAENNDDDAFSGNGLLYADRSISPKGAEAKKVHQSVNFYLEEQMENNVELIVANEFANTSLDEFHITWKLLEDNELIGMENNLNISTESTDGSKVATEKTINITLPTFTPKEGSDYILELSVKYKNNPVWEKSGEPSELAFEQFELNFDNPQPQTVQEDTAVFNTNEVAGETLVLEGKTNENKDFEIKVDVSTGVIESYKLDNEYIIVDGPKQSLWRAQTYNDTSMPSSYRNEKLQNVGESENQKNQNIILNNDSDNIVTLFISAELDVNDTDSIDAQSSMTYNFYGNGDIVVESSFEPTHNFGSIPKVGTRMILDSEYDNVEYYGRGPEENYLDRNSGSKIGVYETMASDMMEENLLKPQENGNRTDVRWMSLTNDEGMGLLVSASDNLLESSVLAYTAEELNSGTYNDADYSHWYEVPLRTDTLVWNIDMKQNGVGDTAFVGHQPLEGAQVTTDKDYVYSYRISPISATTDKMSESNINFEVKEMVNFPVTGISVNGEPIKDFDAKIFEYDVSIAEDAGELNITVDKGQGYSYEVDREGAVVAVTVGDGISNLKYILNITREGASKPLGIDVFAGAEANYYPGNEPAMVMDGDMGTFWESHWGSGRPATISDAYIILELKESKNLIGIEYYPRQAHEQNNSVFGQYELYFSIDGQNWGEAVATGTWANNTEMKKAMTDTIIEAKYVKLVPISTYGNTANDTAGAAEIRVIEAGIPFEDVEITIDKDTYLYTGKEIEPKPTVTINGMKLFDGIDYVVSYSDNVDEGDNTAKVIVTPTASFSGRAVEKSFSIILDPQNDADELLIDKSLIERAVAGLNTPTVSTTPGAILSIVSSEIKYGTIVTWDEEPTITIATQTTAGAITGTLNLSNGAESDTVAVNLIFDKIPTEPEEIFTITFDDGDPTTLNETRMTNTEHKLTDIPTLDDTDTLIYEGWFSDREGGQRITTETVFSEDTTVYAQWIQKYEVIVNLNGGNGNPSGSGYYEEGDVVTIKAGTRSGYSFKGWTSDDVAFENENSSTTTFIMIDDDVTLDASWSRKNNNDNNDDDDDNDDDNDNDSDNDSDTSKPDDTIDSGDDIDKDDIKEMINQFSDVSETDWFYNAVLYVLQQGLFKGISETDFDPNGLMTRAMVWTVLARADGEDTDSGLTWFEQGMAWAISKGISDGTNPSYSITREQLASMLYRHAGSPMVDEQDLEFTDAGLISEWAVDAMIWATNEGIILGEDDGRLDALGVATRAEVATMLMRYIMNQFR